jgi:dTDP-4-dehydrorhamnose reductase
VKRVLLIGGSGRLGTAIRERWTDCEIAAPPHTLLALEDGAALRAAVEDLRPDLLVNAAAFHDVDRCELEPERAFAINAFAVGAAARLACERGVRFVTMSTDYVFDGASNEPYDEAAAAEPLSLYGMSKLAGERLVENSGARAYVVRTSGLYGAATSSSRPSLIDRLLSPSHEVAPLRVVTDVYASPTFAGDLAVALRQLVEVQAYGLYHAVNVGPVSWYDFARTAIDLAGSERSLEPILAAEWKTTAIRPRFSALANARLGMLGITMPSWRSGVAAYLATRE